MKIKTLLLSILLFVGCHKQVTQPSINNTKMGFPTFSLNQTGSSNTLLLNDISGSWSSGNPYGWGLPNPGVGAVTSVIISGIYRPAPSSAAPVMIPSYTLMPTTANPLPYVLNQQFQLSPSQLGFGTNPTFEDGLYMLNVNITVNSLLAFTVASGSGFSEGDPITDVTTGQVLGTLYQILFSTAFYLRPITGSVASETNTITNGTATTTITDTPVFTDPVTYTSICYLLLTANLKCCYGNMLRKNCCGCPDEELDRLRNLLLTSIQQAACFQYNSSLDTMFQAQVICNNSGCNC